MSYIAILHRVLIALALGALFALYGTLTFASVTGLPTPGPSAWLVIVCAWLLSATIIYKWRWLIDLLAS